jgi:large subunit ribosomal protein L24
MTKELNTNRFTPKLHIKKGDKVIVVAGSNKGQSGVVKEVLVEKNRALVDGVNMVKKHVKPTNDEPGGIIEIEAPIHLSNIMHQDPKSGKPTRIGRREEGGKRVRYAKKSGETIK